jgi:chitodextrinase
MVSTTACADTQAPTAPTSLATSNVTQTGAMLTWAAARDNVGVTGYDVSRNGTKVGTVTALSSAQSGLTCNTQYTFAVVASDAAGNSSTQAQVSVTTAACSAPAPPPPPPPPPPSTSQAGVVQLSGTVSPSQLMDAVNAQPSGSVTVQPASGASSFSVSGSLSINRPSLTIKGANVSGEVTFSSGASGSALVDSSAQGFSIKGADNVRIENNTLDGQGRIANNIIWDEPAGNTPDGFVIRGNTLRNYYIDGGDVHSEALYVGYSTNGLIENNSFTNNGNTSHIFFTWFGNTANPSTSYPRNMCVRGNTFGPTHGAYYDVNLRGEIPTSANIKVQRDATLAIPSFYGDC